MEEQLQEFINYLHNVKKASNNTELSYRRDLTKLVNFLKGKGLDSLQNVKEADLNAYVMDLEKRNFTAATVSRNIASIKALFHFMVKNGYMDENHS